MDFVLTIECRNIFTNSSEIRAAPTQVTRDDMLLLSTIYSVDIVLVPKQF